MPATPSMLHMRSITQPWQCKDGRWYLPHFNLPHLHDRVIRVLGQQGASRTEKEAREERGATQAEPSLPRRR